MGTNKHLFNIELLDILKRINSDSFNKQWAPKQDKAGCDQYFNKILYFHETVT